MFKSRVALAATLSSNYGIYNGFELIEHEPHARPRGIPELGEIRDQGPRLEQARQHQGLSQAASTRIRRTNAALLQTNDLRFLQVDNGNVTGFLKESVGRDNAVAVAIALAGAPAGLLAAFRQPSGSARRHNRRGVRAIENLVTGERHMLEWGGVRLRIDPANDPALFFRCIA